MEISTNHEMLIEISPRWHVLLWQSNFNDLLNQLVYKLRIAFAKGVKLAIKLVLRCYILLMIMFYLPHYQACYTPKTSDIVSFASPSFIMTLSSL